MFTSAMHILVRLDRMWIDGIDFNCSKIKSFAQRTPIGTSTPEFDAEQIWEAKHDGADRVV